MRFCNKCGVKLGKRMKFCNKCGTSIQSYISIKGIKDKKLGDKIKVCRLCGKELLPEAVFCPKCGGSVKKVEKKEVLITEPRMGRFLDYCKNKIGLGYSKTKLRKEALKAGWSKTKINKVLKGIPIGKREEPEKIIQKVSKKVKPIKVKEIAKKVEGEHVPRGISKAIFYSVLVVLIIGLVAVSWNLNKYVNELHAMENLYNQQKLETEKYRNMYQQESGIKQQEIQKRQEAEAETSRVRSQLYSEQQRLSEIQIELSSTQTELEQAQEQVGAVKKEVEDIVYTLDNLERWVDENSQLPYDKLNNIHRYCGTYMDYQEDMCVIDAEQMGRDMRACLNFRWVDDEITSNFGTGERIFDIGTFWQSKEGDCDDFALFFAAWLRAEYERAVYSCGASKVYIKLDSSKFIQCPCDIYSVCGAYGNSGHCETGIAMTSYKPGDGYIFFSNLHIIEPQGGDYGGTSFQEFKNVWEFFSKNDFVLVSNYMVTRSIQSAKQKLQGLSI